jgi:hypothetical protein
MAEELLSINALAAQLGRDRRTLSKALKLYPADGETPNGDNLWYRSTAERALDNAAEAAFSGGSDSAVLAAVENTASDLINALARMEREPDVMKRRQMVFDGAMRCIGHYNDALQCSLDTSRNRVIDEILVNHMVGQSIGQLLHLCHWELAPNGDWVPKKADKTRRDKNR